MVHTSFVLWDIWAVRMHDINEFMHHGTTNSLNCLLLSAPDFNTKGSINKQPDFPF